MKLMTLKQYMKMSKPALIRKITKTLRAMPKVKLARLCYNLTKSKLPRLRKITRKGITYKKMPTGRSDKPYYWKTLPKRKTKKKAGIYTAKNGRKYKILASGKARFIS